MGTEKTSVQTGWHICLYQFGESKYICRKSYTISWIIPENLILYSIQLIQGIRPAVSRSRNSWNGLYYWTHTRWQTCQIPRYRPKQWHRAQRIRKICEKVSLGAASYGKTMGIRREMKHCLIYMLSCFNNFIFPLLEQKFVILAINATWFT